MTGLDFLHSQTNLSSCYLKQDNDIVILVKEDNNVTGSIYLFKIKKSFIVNLIKFGFNTKKSFISNTFLRVKIKAHVIYLGHKTRACIPHPVKKIF